MSEYFFLFPVVLGWLMLLSALLQYAFYLKNRAFSKKYKTLFIVIFVLWLASLAVWTFLRNFVKGL